MLIHIQRFLQFDSIAFDNEWSDQVLMVVQIKVLLRNDVAAAERQRIAQAVPIQIDFSVHLQSSICDLETLSVSSDHPVIVRVQIVMHCDLSGIKRKPSITLVHLTMPVQIQISLQFHPAVFQYVDSVEDMWVHIRNISFDTISDQARRRSKRSIPVQIE